MYFDFNLLPFFLSVSLLTIIILAIGIHFYKNYIIMAVIIPVAIACGFFSYNNIVDILGYPVNQPIPEESIYLYHKESPDGTVLFVYALEPSKDKPKSFVMLNTQNNNKQMERAKNRSKRGIPQVLQGKGDRTRGHSGDRNKGEYIVFDFKIDGGKLKQYNRQ